MNIFNSIYSVNIYVFIIAILIVLKPLIKIFLSSWHNYNGNILKKYNECLDNLYNLEESYKNIKEKNDSFNDYEKTELSKSVYNTEKFIDNEIKKSQDNLEYKYNIFVSNLSAEYLQKIYKIIDNINNNILNELSSINDSNKILLIGKHSLVKI